MVKPILLPMSTNLQKIDIQKYERYLPTAFDESLTILEKLNKMIHSIEVMSELTEEMLIKWNEVIDWVMNEGLSVAILDQLNKWLHDGTLARIINEEIFGDLNKRINDISLVVDGLNKAMIDFKAEVNKSLSDFRDELNRNISDVRTEINYIGASNQKEIIAHRGHSSIAPENTIPSMLLAIQNGFDSLECDLHFTSDGQAILMHDDTVDRTTSGTGKVGNLTYSQIRSLDASNKMTFFTGTKVPSFDEFLTLGKGNGLYLYPEIKSGATNAQVKTVVDKVVSHNMENRVIIQSFTQSILEEIRRLNKKIMLACLAQDASVFQLRRTFAKADGHALIIGSKTIFFENPSYVKQAQDDGIEIIAYGITRSRDIQELRNLGIYRYISNDKQGVIA